MSTSVKFDAQPYVDKKRKISKGKEIPTTEIIGNKNNNNRFHSCFSPTSGDEINSPVLSLLMSSWLDATINDSVLTK
jgi:hypothetical protein